MERSLQSFGDMHMQRARLCQRSLKQAMATQRTDHAGKAEDDFEGLLREMLGGDDDRVDARLEQHRRERALAEQRRVEQLGHEHIARRDPRAGARVGRARRGDRARPLERARRGLDPGPLPVS